MSSVSVSDFFYTSVKTGQRSLSVQTGKAKKNLLVDLREFFFRFRVGGTKKNK